ncbi:MAG: YrzE family protein [Oscillospiraceae bacterium]|nr:YrzE family protein [Oscillospiraceae bacterium]
MTKNQKRILAVLAIIFIAYSVVVFALPFQMNGMFWLSYIFAVISVAAQVYVLKTAFDGTESVKSKFYGFPIAQVGVVYMAAQLILSLIFMIFSAITPMWIAVIVFVLLLAAAAIGFISADVMRDEIERQDVKLAADVSCMTTLRSLVYSLPGQCEDTEAKKLLQDLADGFRYSDPVSSESLKDVETELERLVGELQTAVSEGDTKNIISAAKKTENVLDERNRLCKLNKGK